MKRVTLPLAALLLGTIALAGCGSSSGGSGTGGTAATGPIKIWYSTNEQEVAWGKQAVAAWNKLHADQLVTAEEIPAGKSSEDVITAAITAGTTPCLIYNTSPAAVSGFVKQGGLVDLSSFSDGASYIESRTNPAIAKQYQSPDGHYYQLPWKSNPVMIFYNKKIFKAAGIDTTNPPLHTYAEFLDTAKKIVASKAAKYAIYPAPSSEFYQPWFDFYPDFAAATGGKQLVTDGKSQFTSPEGMAVINFWKQIYADNLAGKETAPGDTFADGTAAMASVGPWAISVYKGKVDWGVVPVPTANGMPANQIHTFSDAKNVGLYSSCQNKGTAWDFLKFTTSQAQDGQLLTMTGQMPLRKDLPTTYADYFAKNPDYKLFADQVARTTEVPYVPNSVQIWQTFRDAWTSAVIVGKGDVTQTFNDAATKIDSLAKS
ncbi:MAG: sugar ABC transporter substrate-binding protein [Actinomycetota bacterium]|nr:sugar ABC transporter substrate-binding protein [Actinomycetota bacterium]